MLSVLLVLSCILRKQEIEKEVITAEHFQLHGLWKQGKYEDFERILKEKESSENTQSFWMMANKLYAEKGRRELDEYSLQQAKQYGFRCLLDDSSFRALVELEGGVIHKKAIEVLDYEDPAILQCALWTSIAWNLWLHQRQGHILLEDQRNAQLLAEWVLRYSESDWAHYAVALSESTVFVKNDPNWSKIKDHFQQALNIDPLVEFELFYYHHRIVDEERYCQRKEWPQLNEEYQQRWRESLFVCD